MNIEETRQLGIEFERRVQIMIPEKEFIDKLDSDTIYSFLNQYQSEYVHQIYRSLDSISTRTKLSANIESVLQSLIRKAILSTPITTLDDSVMYDGRSLKYELPEKFYLYLRSVSKVDKTFDFKSKSSTGGVVSNKLVSQSEAQKLIESPYDKLRILRNPIVVLDQNSQNNKPTITVIPDRYTHISGIEIIYYAEPNRFDIMTNTPCELPSEVFDDIVTGAVDMYVQYVAGAESRKKQLAKQQEQQNKKNNEDEE